MKNGDDQQRFWAARISRYLAWLSGGILLVGCAGAITVDVVLRYFLNRTVVESFEISGYAFAAAVALGMAYTVSCKSNIRIDLLANRLPLLPRVILDLVAHLAIVAVAATIAWYALQTWLQSLKLDAKSITILQVPLILPQGIWLAGLIWFALFAAIVAWYAARQLMRGNLAGVQNLIGPATLQEEIEQAGAPAKDAE